MEVYDHYVEDFISNKKYKNKNTNHIKHVQLYTKQFV